MAGEGVVHNDEDEVADGAERDVRRDLEAVEAAKEGERAQKGHRGEYPESAVEQDRVDEVGPEGVDNLGHQAADHDEVRYGNAEACAMRR